MCSNVRSCRGDPAECIQRPNAFRGSMHSEAVCIRRQYAIKPKIPKSQKIVFALNRVATAATDIWAHGLRAQSRHESNAPYQIAYKNKWKNIKFSLLLSLLLVALQPHPGPPLWVAFAHAHPTALCPALCLPSVMPCWRYAFPALCTDIYFPRKLLFPRKIAISKKNS